MNKMELVPGKNKNNTIVLYALSTCIWCQKTKKFLDDENLEYSYIYIDLLDESIKDKYMNELEKWNPACSFPTVVINNKKCIVGYNADKIIKELA